jgi:hypothetical protein
MALQHLGNRLELLPPDYRVTVFSMFVEFGAMSAVIKNITSDLFPLPARAVGESEIDIRDMLVDLVETADQVRYLLRRYAADVYAVTSRDLGKDRNASAAFAAGVEVELVSQIDTITRRLLSELAVRPEAMDQLRETWTEKMRSVSSSAVGRINSDCGPGVFTLIPGTNSSGRSSVDVLPPAARLAILRDKLAPLLGQDREEIST